jgi:hypothetical protein
MISDLTAKARKATNIEHSSQATKGACGNKGLKIKAIKSIL